LGRLSQLLRVSYALRAELLHGPWPQTRPGAGQGRAGQTARGLRGMYPPRQIRYALTRTAANQMLAYRQDIRTPEQLVKAPFCVERTCYCHG